MSDLNIHSILNEYIVILIGIFLFIFIILLIVSLFDRYYGISLIFAEIAFFISASTWGKGFILEAYVRIREVAVSLHAGDFAVSPGYGVIGMLVSACMAYLCLRLRYEIERLRIEKHRFYND